jgi:hypothetical protein
VRGADDSRLVGAVVDMAPMDGDAAAAPRRTTTGEDGAFRFADVDAGVMLLRIRRVGFRPETLQLEVPQIEGGAVVVPLERVAVALDRHVVRSRAPLPDVRSPFLASSGGGRRGRGASSPAPRSSGAGPSGRPTSCGRSRGGTRARAWWRPRTELPGRRHRAARLPALLLARRRAARRHGIDLDAISPHTIEGVEVYSGIATVPGAFRGASANAACGVIAVWTRHGMPRARPTRPTAAATSDVERLVASGAVFTADQVERRAVPLPDATFTPVYPDSLRRVGGRVVAEFVVDAAGTVGGRHGRRRLGHDAGARRRRTRGDRWGAVSPPPGGPGGRCGRSFSGRSRSSRPAA